MAERRRVGLIVNPIAGIGGPLAMRGSDHFASMAEAERLGGRPVAGIRAERALRRLRALHQDLDIVAAPGPMGADAAKAAGFSPAILDGRLADATTAHDTRVAADALMRRGVDLILFAGGDGTACDVFAVVADGVALVGIPTGVKMHSAVFAVSPEAAGETVAMALRHACPTRPVEIMDSDPAELAAGRPSAHLFGYALTPTLPRLMQAAKASRPADDQAALEALGRRLARQAKQGQLTLVGPGTTMAPIKRAFGAEATLMGVDAFVDGRLVAAHGDAETLAALCRQHRDTRLVVGIVGGQGFVFGRGNQQLSPEVLRAIAPEDIRIVASREKLLALGAPQLWIDTGDVVLDRMLEGYRRIDTGPNDTMVMVLKAASG
jgi:predicted polyphosphate/ATP-dependent NAD kinase